MGQVKVKSMTADEIVGALQRRWPHLKYGVQPYGVYRAGGGSLLEGDLFLSVTLPGSTAVLLSLVYVKDKDHWCAWSASGKVVKDADRAVQLLASGVRMIAEAIMESDLGEDNGEGEGWY